MFFAREVLASVMVLAAAVFAVGQADQEIKSLNEELGRQYAAAKYDEAHATAVKLVAVSTAKFGKEDLQTARAWKNRGFVENAKGDAKSAENSLDKAADIFEKHAGLSAADGASYAEVLEAIGGFKARRNMLEAEPVFKRALKWREKSGGADAVETAIPLAALGNISFWQRDYKKASELYERALQQPLERRRNSFVRRFDVYLLPHPMYLPKSEDRG